MGPEFPRCCVTMVSSASTAEEVIPWATPPVRWGHVIKICFGEQNVRFQLNKCTRANRLHTLDPVSMQRSSEWKMVQPGVCQAGWRRLGPTLLERALFPGITRDAHRGPAVQDSTELSASPTKVILVCVSQLPPLCVPFMLFNSGLSLTTLHVFFCCFDIG